MNTYVVIIFVCVHQIGVVKQLKLRYLGTSYKTPIYVWLFKQKSKRKYNHLFWCVFKYYAPWAIVFRGYVCPRVMPQQCLVTWWLRSWRRKIWRGYFLSPSVSHFQTYILRHSVCNKCHMCTENSVWIYVFVREKNAMVYCIWLWAIVSASTAAAAFFNLTQIPALLLACPPVWSSAPRSIMVTYWWATAYFLPK